MTHVHTLMFVTPAPVKQLSLRYHVNTLFGVKKKKTNTLHSLFCDSDSFPPLCWTPTLQLFELYRFNAALQHQFFRGRAAANVT